MNNWQNNIPKHWTLEKFRHIAELRHGYQFRDYDFTEKGIKIFKITQIKGEGITDISNCSFIDEGRINQFEKFVIKKGDILIALTGATIGKIARFSENEVVLQNYRVGNFFPLDKKILSKDYLYQFLRSDYFYSQILSGQTQSAQQNIGKEDINNMSVILPPLQEQHAIAEILSALDDKIELNLQTNKTLEEMANALYKHWFVDFDPLKDERFVETELGSIPEGWKVMSINDATSLIIDYRGKTPKKLGSDWINKSDSAVQAISAKNIKKGCIVQPDTIKYLSEDLYNIWMKEKLAEFDVLLTSEAPLGETFILLFETKYCLSQRLFALRSNPKILNPFLLYFFLNFPVGQNQLQGRASGSTVQGIQQSELRKLSIIIPPIEIQSIVANEFEDWLRLKRKKEEENKHLGQIRDYLLPKLITGAIRVKDAAKMVKEVV